MKEEEEKESFWGSQSNHNIQSRNKILILNVETVLDCEHSLVNLEIHMSFV